MHGVRCWQQQEKRIPINQSNCYDYSTQFGHEKRKMEVITFKNNELDGSISCYAVCISYPQTTVYLKE